MASKKKNKSNNDKNISTAEKNQEKEKKEEIEIIEGNTLEKKTKQKVNAESNKKKIEEKAENIDKKIAEIEKMDLKEENKTAKDKSQKSEKVKKKKNSTEKNNEKEMQEEKNKGQEERQKQLIERNIEKKKKSLYIAISILVICSVVLLFSTIFAILNINNSNIIKGIKIKGINVSGLTLEEAKSKITEALNIELLQELNLKYNDEYEVEFDVNQIEYKYNLDSAIEEAYQYGRKGNIIENNYSILCTAFFGKNIDIDYTYNEKYLDDIIIDIESKIPGLVIHPTYYIEESELIINKGKDGISVDKEKLKEEILSNIKNRYAEEIVKSSIIQELEIPVMKTKANKIDIEQIYSDIYTEPKDAYYELEPFKIFPEEDGIDLEISVQEAKKQIESEDKEEYRFPLKITPAEKTIKDLGTEAFPYLISSFSTKYDASNKNRSQNLAIAAQKINGTVLMPGETFSFNKVVGKRTVEEGYKDAKIYVDGGVVDGLAGGICQISSTLYNAVLLANLEIVERRNHSFTTSYVPAGRDATVVYGTTDFQFKNSRTYPIKIEAEVSNGIAIFKIHGIAEETEYEVKIIPKTTQSIPYTTQYIQDATLAPGEQVVVQSGHSGYKVTTYKEIRKDGVVISREVLSNDTYKVMKAIVRIGP